MGEFTTTVLLSTVFLAASACSDPGCAAAGESCLKMRKCCAGLEFHQISSCTTDYALGKTTCTPTSCTCVKPDGG